MPQAAAPEHRADARGWLYWVLPAAVGAVLLAVAALSEGRWFDPTGGKATGRLPRFAGDIIEQYAALGAPVGLILACALTASIERGRRRLLVPLCVTAAYFAAGGVTQLIKITAARARPDQVVTESKQLVDDSSGWSKQTSKGDGGRSFPSGHATSAFAMAAVLARRYLALRWTAPLLAAPVAFSRCCTLHHWPSDVVAGGMVGWYGGIGIAIVFERLFPEPLPEPEGSTGGPG